MPRTSWNEFGQMLSFMDRLLPKKRDLVEEAQDLATLESTGLDIVRKRRELQGPSPSQKYQEEQRSQQIGSALEMFGNLYKTASPASKKRLAEQMTSLWGLMTPVDQTKFKMFASHTPINPRVQKAQWFEETNPRPQMPIVKGGDGSWTNNPPRTPDYRKVWAEFDIASDEWEVLKEMAVGEKGEKPKRILPRQYQTDDPNVTAERNPLTRRIEFTDWNEIRASEAEVTTAVEKNWATWSDIKATGSVPIAQPREINFNGTLITSTQRRDLKTGAVKLDYKPLGPLDESKLTPSDSLRDAANFATGDIDPRAKAIKVKDPSTLYYFDTLQGILTTRGKEQKGRLETFQNSLVANEPDPLKRFIPFIHPGGARPTFWEKVLDWVPFVDFPSIEATEKGITEGITLRQADRLVPFSDADGKQGLVWWSDVSKVGYYSDGTPIKESVGKEPGSQLNIKWGK